MDKLKVFRNNLRINLEAVMTYIYCLDMIERYISGNAKIFY